MVSVRLFRLRGVTCIEPVGGLCRFCFTWYSEYDLHQSGFPKAACRYRRLHIYIPVTLVWVTMLPCAEVSIQETMFLTTASQYFHGPHENHLWVMAGDTAAKELWCLTRALRRMEAKTQGLPHHRISHSIRAMPHTATRSQNLSPVKIFA